MPTIERTLARPPADVFDILIEPRTYPHWLVGAKKIRFVSPSWPQRDSYFEHVVGFGPIATVDRTTSKGFVEGRELELFVRARPFLEATVRFELEPHPGGCRLRMIETPSGLYKLISPFAQPLIAARNDRSLDRLTSLVHDSRSSSTSHAPATENAT